MPRGIGYDSGVNAVPSLPETPDESHVKLLAIFSFVLAGLGLLGLAFVVFHYVIMSSVFDNPRFWDQIQAQARQQHQPRFPFDPQHFFHLFVWFYFLMGSWSLLSIAANIAAGLSLLRFRARTFCLVAAALNCVNFPFGTLLGVFTILVLVRPVVVARFAANGGPAGLPPAF